MTKTTPNIAEKEYLFVEKRIREFCALRDVHVSAQPGEPYNENDGSKTPTVRVTFEGDREDFVHLCRGYLTGYLDAEEHRTEAYKKVFRGSTR